jgi:dolichol-phosphate mannosyltransferase
MSISIIIPVYNEILNLDGTYANLSYAINLLKLKDYEIIFINDCSTDESLAKLKKIKKKNINIRIINNKINIGLSESIQKGIKFSKKEFIWWLPSDDNLKYKEIIKMLKHYSDFDFIYTKHLMKRNYFRKFVSHSFTVIVNFIFNLNFSYYNSLFLVKKKHLKKISIKSKSQFWMAELSIKLLSISNNFETRTLKLNERKAGSSNIFNLTQLYKTVIDLIKFRLNSL